MLAAFWQLLQVFFSSFASLLFILRTSITLYYEALTRAESSRQKRRHELAAAEMRKRRACAYRVLFFPLVCCFAPLYTSVLRVLGS